MSTIYSGSLRGQTRHGWVSFKERGGRSILLPVSGLNSPGGGGGPNDEFCIKNDELCIQNDEFCIKNDELCIKNDELCIKNDGRPEGLNESPRRQEDRRRRKRARQAAGARHLQWRTAVCCTIPGPHGRLPSVSATSCSNNR